MSHGQSRSTTIDTYVGKVRVIEGDEVRVSLWDSSQQEIVGMLPRRYFPEAKLEVGQVFKYRARISVEMVPPRELSPEEIARMYAEIERRIPADEF